MHGFPGVDQHLATEDSKGAWVYIDTALVDYLTTGQFKKIFCRTSDLTTIIIERTTTTQDQCVYRYNQAICALF